MHTLCEPGRLVVRIKYSLSINEIVTQLENYLNSV